MVREAEVLIRTRILLQDAEDVVELSVPAKVCEKNNSCFIMYEETDSDNGAKTLCRIRLLDDRMEITRKGQIDSYMELAAGKDTVTDYRTPYGILKWEVHTDILRVNRMSNCLEVRAEYSLLTDGELMSRNEMTLKAAY